jgi:acetylornithine deacetylase
MDIPSVTTEEGEASLEVASWLDSLGYDVFLQDVPQHGQNVWAFRDASSVDIVLTTHIDTVPPFIASTEDSEFIYGRGATDAKQLVVTQVLAAEQLIEQGAVGAEKFGLLFVVGEEDGAMGIQFANQIWEDVWSPKYAIFGEPTESGMAIGTKGTFGFQVVADGQAGHSGYPEVGDSAISKILPVLSELDNAVWPSDPVYGATTLNIGQIEGGVASNVIPESASANILMRISVDDVTEIVEKVTEITNKEGIRLLYTSTGKPRIGPLVTLSGYPEYLANYATDIPYLEQDVDILLVGSGSILVSAMCIVCMYMYNMYLCTFDVYLSIYQSIYLSIHPSIYACIHTYIHTYVRTYMHAYIRPYTHTYMRAYARTYIHTYLHTYTHTYIYIYIYIYTIDIYMHT